MLPWLIVLGTVAVAIGIGAILVSGEAADEHRRRPAPVPKPPFLPDSDDGRDDPMSRQSCPVAAAKAELGPAAALVRTRSPAIRLGHWSASFPHCGSGRLS
jgi:hypothetical protein